MAKGLIADIRRASFHEGSGIRTTVFFKGCPLKCTWCHNPECLSPEPQELFYRARCIGCGGCADGCFSGARVICGKKMEAEEVLLELLLDRPYYDKNGGVTFTGGEPLMQLDFLKECVALCKSEGIGCAVETSLHYFDESLFRSLDFVMADLKIWDDEIHRLYTGVGNDHIKENCRRLNALGVPIIARTPVIPEIEQGIDRISAFLKSLDHVVRYELLPYHALGTVKAEAMGYKQNTFSVPSGDYMKELEQYAYVRR